MSKHRKSRRSISSMINLNARTRLPHIEQLEERRLLFASHVIAQFDGNLNNTVPLQQIPFSLAANDFNLSGAKCQFAGKTSQ